LMIRLQPSSTRFPYTTLFRSIDQNWFGGKLPFTIKDDMPDYKMLRKASDCKPIHYPKPDNKLTFDRLSSVFLSNTNHEEEQPCQDRKSTRLNSSHVKISYAVF